jgi:MFS family permease
MERQTISNPKLDALMGVLVLALFAAMVSPVVLQYSPWRWPVCGAFIIIGVVSVVALRRVAAREEKKIYRELQPRSKIGRRLVALAYGLFGVVALSGVVAFAKIANDAFRSHRPRLGFQMVALTLASAGVVTAVVRGVRLQLEEPIQPPQTTTGSSAPDRV